MSNAIDDQRLFGVDYFVKRAIIADAKLESVSKLTRQRLWVDLLKVVTQPLKPLGDASRQLGIQRRQITLRIFEKSESIHRAIPIPVP